MVKVFGGIIVFILLMGNSANAWQQTGKDAITSLKKLEAKTQMDVSYDDYLEQLATTKSKVNFFLESPEAKNKIKLAEAMKKALYHFDFAMLIWMRAKQRIDMESELSQTKHPDGWWPIKLIKGKKDTLEERQKLDRARSIGKSSYYLDKRNDFDILQRISSIYLNKSIITEEKYHINQLLPIMWRQASNEVKNATNAFYKKAEEVKEASSDKEIEGSGLIEEIYQVTEDTPVTQPKKSPRKVKSKPTKSPPAPPAPVKASIFPEIRDQD